MPSLDDVFRYFTGVWKLMLGHKDGLNYLDISADDFWQSFNAIPIALPPLLGTWVAYAAELTAGREEASARLAIVTRAAIVDIAAWIIPLIIIGLLAQYIGIAKRYAAYVIATNWASALLAWIFAPIALLQLFFPSQFEVATILVFLMFGITIIFSYRLTFAVLQKPHSYVAPFFTSVFMGTLFITLILQQIFGIGIDAQNY